MMIDLAVFDMAGTTVTDDFFVENALQKAFEKAGISLQGLDTAPLMGYPKPIAIQMILEQLGVEFDDDSIAVIHRDFVAEMISFYALSPAVAPMPGAEELFGYLKKGGAKITLNTGFSRNIAAVIVERFGWQKQGLIDAFIGSDEVAQGRPYPDMINSLKEQLQIPANARVLKVGDTVVDVMEGRNVGCTFNVAVTTGSTPKEVLLQQGPTHTVAGLSEIPAILQAATHVYA